MFFHSQCHCYPDLTELHTTYWLWGFGQKLSKHGLSLTWASGHKLLTKIFKTVLTWVQSPAAQHMWIALRIYRITLLFCVFSFRPRVNITQVNAPPVKWIESPVKQTNAFLLPGPGKLMFLASNSLSNWTAKFSENCPPGSGRAAEFPARWWNVFSSLPLSSLLLV